MIRNKSGQTLSLLTALLLMLAGCIQAVPDQDDPGPLYREPEPPPPSVPARWTLHWHSHLDGPACLETGTADTCEDVPKGLTSSANPTSGHAQWHRVEVQETSVAVEVRATWHDEQDGTAGAVDAFAEPGYAVQVWCWTSDGGPCTPDGHMVAHAAGTAPALVLDEVGLEWYDESAHHLWLGFRVLPKEVAGLNVYPDVQTSFEVEATFEVGHK